MKLKVIIPISGLNDKAIQNTKEYLEKWVSSTTHIDVVLPESGPSELLSEIDTAKAVPILADLVTDSKKYDGILISCFDDPGIRAFRELVDIPVIGAFEASMNMLSHAMDEVIVFAPDESSVPSSKYKISTSKFRNLVVDIMPIKIVRIWKLKFLK